MKRARLSLRQWIGYAGFVLVGLLAIAVLVWRGDILRAGLDPEIPFQAYSPPPEPDYSRSDAWAMREVRIPGAGPAAIFFVHSTTHDGGRQWNGPIGDPRADAYLHRVVLPNYAGPFARAGAITAPLYRQASLYARLTLREDAREARVFAYGDVETAFEVWLARHRTGPIVLAGVEQGGEILDRLIRERIAPDPELRERLVAAYLVETLVAEARLSPHTPACAHPGQTGCVLAWSPVREGRDSAARRRLRRALVWTDRGRLESLGDRAAVCVNPITGSRDGAAAPARLHRGATNATGLEWGARPALMAREISAQCRGGILFHSRPTEESFGKQGDWAERRKAQPYNLFYGDIEADVAQRLAAWRSERGGAEG